MRRDGKWIQKHHKKKQVGEGRDISKTLRRYHTEHQEKRQLCDCSPGGRQRYEAERASEGITADVLPPGQAGQSCHCKCCWEGSPLLHGVCWCGAADRLTDTPLVQSWCQERMVGATTTTATCISLGY